VYRITAREDLASVTKLLKVEAPDVARKAKAGQFVVVCVNERGERIPLTIAEYDRESGEVTIVFQEVGKTTKLLGTMGVGDELASFAGPLGHPTEIEDYGTVVCVGGGAGIAVVYPIAQALKQKMRSVSNELIVCTDDGSQGRKALVTEPLKEILGNRKVDVVWAIGPTVMMKFCALTTKPFSVKTIVSLNSIMVDGTGMCGSCRVEVGGETKFVCVDGPEFDGHEVDWNLLMGRQRMYLAEEKRSLEEFEAHQCKCQEGD